MGDVQIVIFSLNDEICGAYTSQVQEIVKYQEVTKLPNMPEFIDGIINLRGSVVPIVNLNKRFAFGETEITKKTKIIITKIENMLIGYIVNDVSEIIKLPEENIEAPTNLFYKVGNTYLKNIGKRDGKLILILDLGSILNDRELKHLDESEIEKAE
ncbi:MAG: chemotaxis protein CheW [Clostridia bacterium]|nr:chemotaxis protein CheW [Clostridia bacterium]